MCHPWELNMLEALYLKGTVSLMCKPKLQQFSIQLVLESPIGNKVCLAASKRYGLGKQNDCQLSIQLCDYTKLANITILASMVTWLGCLSDRIDTLK